ncbi:pupal cuticle protein Edg-78E [Drosophila innubila]|uniref:pupal cuticle protein Edg-78E n=1 Tax=Drosophila innubila TaxID=198719 RepID=UPI00148C7711|nr:pupal cuticle protein Edg-78E [Drosophila innubila]
MLNHKLIYYSCFLLVAFSFLVSADESSPDVLLLNHFNHQNLNGAGQYEYGVKTDHGIDLKAKGDVNRVEGEYFLPAKEGETPQRVTYVADATGFHPHIEN